MSEGNEFQRTAEWYQDRLGHLTASSAFKVLERTAKGKPTAKYEDYLNELVAERLTGLPTEVFVNKDMQWGIEHEEEAKKAYIMRTNPMILENVGFIKHPTVKFLGASPDGLVDDDGLVEIKCPKTATHIKRLRTGEIPEEYRYQMALQMICTGRKWCDYVDFDPRIEDPRAQIMIVRYTIAEEEKKNILESCRAFLDEVQQECDRLCSKDYTPEVTAAEKEDPIFVF